MRKLVKLRYKMQQAYRKLMQDIGLRKRRMQVCYECGWLDYSDIQLFECTGKDVQAAALENLLEHMPEMPWYKYSEVRRNPCIELIYVYYV